MGKNNLKTCWIRTTQTYNDVVLKRLVTGNELLKVDENRARELITKGLAYLSKVEKKVCL